MQNEAESQPSSLPQNSDDPNQPSSIINIDNSKTDLVIGINNANVHYHTHHHLIEKKILKKSPPRVWLPKNKSKLCQYFEIELKLRGIVISSEYATDYDYYVVWFNQIEPDEVDRSILPWIQSNIAQQKAIFTEKPAGIHATYTYICKSLVNLDQGKTIDSEDTAQAHARALAKQLISEKFKHNSDALALAFQSERPFNPPIEADLALDWYDYQQNINNNADKWQRGQEALYDLREWIGDAHPLALNTQSLGYFPALMLGSTFYLATSYILKAINYFNKKEWQLLINTKPSDVIDCSFHNIDKNSTICVLNICFVHTQNQIRIIEDMDTYSRKYINNIGGILSIYPKDNQTITIDDSKDASAIISFIIDRINKLPKHYHSYHLIISAPVALVVLLGQRLNGYQSWFLHEYIKTSNDRPEQDHYYRLINFPIIAQATPNRSIS